VIRATAPLPDELESVLERLRGQESGQIGGVGSIGGSSEATQSVAPVEKRPA
jgi:hypothetical protein